MGIPQKEKKKKINPYKERIGFASVKYTKMIFFGGVKKNELRNKPNN